MADTSAWSHHAVSGHYGSSAAQHSSAAYYPPPIFSSSAPSYTLTQTFTFPSYLHSPPSLRAQSQHHSTQLQQQQQSPLPSLSFPGFEPSSSSAASIFHSPHLSSAITAASPSLLSATSALSSSSSLPTAYPSSSDSSSSSRPSSRSRLSAPERKARRAAKHRAIDLTRRTREAAALTQLKQLLSPSSPSSSFTAVSASSPTVHSDGSHSGAVSDGAAVAAAAAAAALSNAATDSKAAVLEQTVAEVLRLRAVIDTQQALLSGQTAPLHRPVNPPLPHALSPDWAGIYNHHITHHSPPLTPPSASSATAASSASASTLSSLSSDLHTLYSSFFLHSPYHLTLVQPGTAACIDTNQSFLSHARLGRGGVVGKRITLCPAVRLLLDRGDSILADEFMGGRGVDCGRERQAANGLSLVRLYSGAEETVLCVFRYVLGDGRVVDMRGRCWLTKGRFSGVVGEAPLMIVQSSDDDYTTISST